MTPPEDQPNPVVETPPAAPPPGMKVARWISVIILGCSLGLFVVFLCLSARIIPKTQKQIIVTYRARPQQAQQLNPSDEPVEKELTEVITSQLAAFRDDDYSRAYGFAASDLRAQIPLSAFERMVKNRYPIIAQSRKAQFGVSMDNGESAVVNVTVFGTEGEARHYQYFMQHERTGWKISGVKEIRQPAQNVI